MFTSIVQKFSCFRCSLLVLASFLAVGCQNAASTKPGTVPLSAIQPPKVVLPTIRINAGSDAAVTDAKGVVWAADSGFSGGETVDRPELPITGTDQPQIYKTERYSMDSYSFKLPNGEYVLKLHFSEDYDGLTSSDDRKFTYTIKDGTSTGKVIKEVKSFSPWKASGAQFKAYVDSIPTMVTKGEITIVFTPEAENPQINAIEILPK